MIEGKCGDCGQTFSVNDNYAGKTGKCPNCGAPVSVPAAASSASPSFTQSAAGPTIIVQVQGQPQGGAKMIGPASKSYFLIFILSCICAGLQYFYIGQTGKGLVFTLVTLFVMCPLVFITCGIGAFIAAPYGLFLLIESFVIASKMKTQAVGPWRFF